MPRPDLSVGAWAGVLWLTLGTLVVALAGIVLTRETGNIAVLWPANGLLAGILLRMPGERRPVAIAASLLATTIAFLLAGDPPWLAVGLAGCNMFEVLLAHAIASRLAGPTLVLAELRQLFVLFAAGLIAPALSATVATAVLGSALGMSASALWRNWWASHAVGMLLILPLVTALDAHFLRRLIVGPRDRRLVLSMLELGAAFALLGGAVWFIVGSHAYGSPALFTPVLLWLALRFGACAVATAATLIVVAAVAADAYQVWPLPFTPGLTVASRVVPLQLFAALVTVPALVVAVLIRQRTQVLRRLDSALESMADGFALFDVASRLVICNRRYQEYLAPVADRLTAGARFEDIVREGARRGMFALDHPAETETRIADLIRAQNAKLAREVKYSNGRWLQVVPRATADDGTVVVCRDITERKLLEQTLEHMAMHDPLTDLPNRKLYDLELRRARARAQRDGHRLALMLLDLDRFKEVNDSYGHQIGDRLLVEVGHRLVSSVRQGDLVARVGGDEFAVLAEGTDGNEGVALLARRILDRLSEPLRLAEIELHPQASLGVTLFPDDPAELDEFVTHADRALYAAKAAGGRTWRLFKDSMSRGGGGSEQIAGDIAGALDRGEFHLHYQPIVATGAHQVIGIEALLRWHHPRRGRLPAGAFIAAAEPTPAIFPLTRFVLASTLRQQRAWRESGVADLPVWVNLAPPCLRWDGLLEAVTGTLAAAGVAPGRLVLEVTERSFVDLERAADVVDELKRLGVGLALDDFGASYSSLGRLRALRMDVIKIDRSFISDLVHDPRDRAVVQAMVRLANSLGMTPLAEGVETDEQLRVLQDLGCTWAQGHLFARPLPAPELARWLAAPPAHALDRPEALASPEPDGP